MTEVCHIFFTFVVRQTGPLGYPPADHAVRKFLADIDNDVDMDSLSYIRAQHFLNVLFRVTLSKKESRTKVAKNCTKSLYSQVSVKIFDKVKQSHLSVSQSQLKLREKSPKKKP